MLARGYLNRGGLTAERFIADPFDEGGGRLYRTGDLARWRSDGQIEYLGRLDHQVKIRGFRIELGEIETQLLAQPGVREAVVVAREGAGASNPAGGARLVAYVSLHADAEMEVSRLREALGKVLPDYMLPSAIVVLESLPLNPSGKVDRKALPEPEFTHTEHYEAPQGEAEEVLAGIWGQVLGVAEVGRHDNFFELGGDSILSLQIVTRARRAGWKITPRQLFERQTIASLAAVAMALEAQDATVATLTPIASAEPKEGLSDGGSRRLLPLLPIQAEFFAQEIPARHHWNQAALLESREHLDPAHLGQALEAVVRHHDALRFRFARNEGGQWQQFCGQQFWGQQPCGESISDDLLWVRKAATAADLEALCNEAQRSLNLIEGPLLRAVLFDMDDGSQRLLLVIHHLVIDGVSWRILLEDLQNAYSQARNAQAIALPEKSGGYEVWIERLQRYVHENTEELVYWRSLTRVPAILPRDNPEGASFVRLQCDAVLKLGKAQTRALLKEAPAAYRTHVNDLLLTALGSALCWWSGHKAILIDLEGHGREDLYDTDLSQTVGWFTTLYPVMLDPSGDLDQRIKRIKENLRKIPNKGLGYGLFKYHGTPEQREFLASLPKPEVVFNYLGQLDASFDESALWTLAAESIGDLTDENAPLSHDISINGHVYEGELCLTVSYSDARYHRATIEAFMNVYQAELETLIVHCTSGIQGLAPSDFPLVELTQRELDSLPVATAQLEDLYPLSPLQGGILFHSVFDRDDHGVYLNQLRADIEGLDATRFKAAWQAAVACHPVLRTGFVIQDSKPLQWVAKSVELPFVEHDWRTREDKEHREDRERDLEALARAEHASGFDLTRPPLMRLALVRLTDERYHFIWTIHHLLLDGWSTSQLAGEVLRRYAGELSPVQEASFRDRGEYRRFIEWLQHRDMEASEAYWRERLKGIGEPTRLAATLPAHRENSDHEEYGEHFTELSLSLSERLIQFARRERVTLNTLIQGVWAILLSRYTGKQTVLFGATVAGRPATLPGAEHLLGLFINTLPVSVTLQPEYQIGAWLRDLQAQNLASREHEQTPLYEIQRWLGQSGQGLFDSILVFENYPMDEALRESTPGGPAFSNIRNRESSNYPMMVSVMQGNVLSLGYSYDCRYFSRTAVESIAKQLKRLLDRIATTPANSPQRLGDIDILSEADWAQLKVWGINEQRYANTEPVHRLIERQAEERSGAVALVFGDVELSYGELNRRANRLSHRLIRLGVGPEVKVGIAVERSIDMVVGLLAILKAGGAYVPLDPEYPQERLAYMVTDSGIGLLLTQSRVRSAIPHSDQCVVLELDRLDLEEESGSNPQVALHGHNLAYIIYTSGSTGKPKGVGVVHHALSHFLTSMGELPGMNAQDTLAAVTALSFDIAALELYLPLSVGARLVLVPQGVNRDGLALAQLLQTHRPSVLQSTPAGWRMLLAAGWDPLQGKAEGEIHGGDNKPFKPLKALCGGEALQPDLAGQLCAHGVELWNMYGPTETTIWSAVGKIDQSGAPVLGKPIAATRAYILDANLNPVLPGVAGELYLGGIGLARGYPNRGGLTAERFIADPFDEEGGRLYRTGDLARWRGDGQIEYLGRLDHQVKIRGFRIELGEIEAQLLAQPEIREAVVVAREGADAALAATDTRLSGGAKLVAYVSSHGGEDVDVALLRQALAKGLPDYMIPAAIVVLESLPLNPNGKVDRKALPDPEFANTERYEAPQGEVEEVLATIWAQVLGVAQVGRHDNFFELGGDSILSLQIVTKAWRAGLKITPRQLFEQQTIASLAETVEAIEEPIAEPAKPERGYLRDYLGSAAIAGLPFTEDEIEDAYPLSPTQEGMLFHTMETAAEGAGLYVNQLSVEVEGLDPQRLANAWMTMVSRHPILRTGFLWQAGLTRPLQIIFKKTYAPVAPVVHLDWRGLDALESRVAAYAEDELRREFDFLMPPLARLALIRLADDRYQLVWTRHHILLDAWGDAILISDWLRCYAGQALAAPGPDYGHYVRWLLQQDEQATKAFWEAELAGVEGPTLLAKSTGKTTNGASEPDTRSGFAQIYTLLSIEETRRLKAFAQRQQVTLNTFVQAAWALLLQRYTGKDTVVFGATVAGRPPSLSKAEEIVGMFINTIPVPVERKSELTVAEYLGLLQKMNARLREHEHASLADIQRWAGSSGRPLFDSIVVFENYPIDEAMRSNELYGLRFGEIKGKGLTGYVMDLQVVVDDRLEIEYCYGRAELPDDLVLDLRAHMEFLMREMMAHPERRVGELGWMEKREIGHLLALGSNAHLETLPSRLSRQFVHNLIEQNAEQHPEAIALLMGEQELSYAELNERANRLAHHLARMGVGPEVRVGVAMERSLEVIVTLLGVLKTGGAYVPLDPEYPVERLSFMVKDSGMSLLLTEEKLLAKLGSGFGVQALLLDSLDLAAESGSNPDIPLHEHNLAYIIYTSGSTGLPKGVAVAHGPLSMHCRATAGIYGMTSHSCELLFMSFSFDGAHERWLTALTVGAGLAVRDQELWTAEQTYDALHSYGITNAAFPPAYLGQVAEWAAPRSDPPPVELYVFGGEAMPKASYDLVRKTLRPRILINGYGPTETVVTPLIWKTEASNSFDCAYAPIGRPVGERTAYVLDVDMQAVPVGMIGELYIGGYGLARGYLERAGLTAERFVADPFDGNGGRLYRTGDLVRWLEDGNIEYIGRADHQVKIRGFRIELGEIEACVRELTGLTDIAVVVREGAGGPQLAAYVVRNETTGTTVPARKGSAELGSTLKQQLARRLPEYMVPTHIVILDELPRLPSGKLDRSALPEPDAVAADTYRAPSTPEARLLAQIWQEVLGVERVGETDNFFALGGDSLSSLKVMARMRNLPGLKFDFKLRDLMQRPTIAGLLGPDVEASDKTQPLLLLNQRDEKAQLEPLFCIHAGLGTVFDYQPLARHLQGKRTVYGIPCRMLSDPQHRDTSLDKMAADYVQIIRRTQPEGPYHLSGWSLGGTLAAMMAALLEAEGQEVAFLGLIDSFIPVMDESEPDDWRQDFSDFVSVVLPGAKIDGADGVFPDGNQKSCLQSLKQPSREALAGLLDELISTMPASEGAASPTKEKRGGYADLGASELARIFGIARHLKALAAQAPELGCLNIQPACWWIATRPLSDRLALSRQTGQPELSGNEIDIDHFSIIRAEALFVEMESRLRSGGARTAIPSKVL
ncbi:non-ribosomal peptide synthetase [Nitrosospira multiformis]|uniref:non-ribosomal peptide synthetase n=1 Tax=Nitrosospira multiformis TaxID=1231 RepID=UPI0021103CF9|nr:non-ribosomal peptide synthetase [Nitrosospira multiformis]